MNTPLQGGCLDAAVAKRAEGKFIEKGGVTTLVPPPKQLHLGAFREQKIDFVGTKSSSGVVSGVSRASAPATKTLASNPVRGLHSRQFL